MGSDDENQMPRRGILFRLSASERPETKTDPVDSIVANLRSILNTDRGISPCAPELGLSLHQMLSDWNTRKPEVLEDIQAVLEQYEPRLRNVQVKALGEVATFRLSILIEGELADGQTLRLRTDMSASGDARIERIVQEV